jgi:enoyl-CoA hydratase
VTNGSSLVEFAVPKPHIAVVTINRPDVRNAINAEVTRRLRELVEQTEGDAQIRAVVLTGAGGKAFCAGADLREVAAGRMSSVMDEQNGFAGFVHAKRRKVWIAAVEGFALAGGFEILLACELAVASEGSSFGLPEVRRGLVAAAGGAYRAVRALPQKLGLELIATGGLLSAQRAYDLGLLNALTPLGGALEAAMRLAEQICESSPTAVRESLTIARSAEDLTDGDLRRMSDEALDRTMRSGDFYEGALAFVEKRPARWLER